MQIETGERISNPNYTEIIVEYNGGYFILTNCYGFISVVNQESTGIPQIRGLPNFN